MTGCALIPGGAGFIGSHLADSLMTEGRVVTFLDDFSFGRRKTLLEAGYRQLRIVEVQ